MKYSGDMLAFSETKEFLLKKNRTFKSERSGNTGKIYIRDKVYFYFNKGLDASIPNLCRSVNQDVRKWLKSNKNAKITDSKKIVHFNKEGLINSVGNLVYGWDINACYWNIAFREGYISLKTYEKGNLQKKARLQAIGNLNKSNFILECSNGEITKKKIVPDTAVIWSLINDEVYQMYLDIKNIIGDDLLCWYTDCLYASNDYTEILTKYFSEKQLSIKQENIQITSLGKNKVNYWSYKNEREMAFRFIF